MAGAHLDKARQTSFSATAINRAVNRETLQKPYVLYPVALGVLGIMASVLIAPTSFFVIPAVAGSLMGAGAWLADRTLRREHHVRRYLSGLQEQLAGQLSQTIQDLQKEFDKQQFTRGQGQLQRLNRKFATFRELLQKKLRPEELTHARYLGITEQVFLAGVDNLSQALDLLKGVRAIDDKEMGRRLQQLRDTGGSLSELEQRELQALQSRMLLFQQQREKLDRLLTQNEEAMTQIDLVMAAISGMDTEREHASVDMETAMQELQRLAERAHHYAKTD